MNEERLEKRLRKDFERKIRALRKKAEEFKAKGDLSRAENCLFLARYLKDFIRGNLYDRWFEETEK